MAKFAISASSFFAAAIISLLDTAGYSQSGNGADENDAFFLVNTDKRTYKGADNASGRTTYSPTSQWDTFAALVNGTTPPVTAVGNVAGLAVTVTAAAPTTRTRRAAVTPASVVGANGTAIAIGDTVLASNSRTTKAKFRLQSGHYYTVDRITATGKVGLAGLPNDEYLAKRFTKVNGARVTAVAPARAAARVVANDSNGRALTVGATVLYANAIHTVASVPSNGVVKLTGSVYTTNAGILTRVSLVDTAPRSGDKVVCVRDHKNSRSLSSYANSVARNKFALPLNTALTFRGLTVEKGNYILDGYNVHQYAPSRFKTVKIG